MKKTIDVLSVDDANIDVLSVDDANNNTKSKIPSFIITIISL